MINKIYIFKEQPSSPILCLPPKKASHENFRSSRMIIKHQRWREGNMNNLYPSTCAEYHPMEMLNFFEATFSVFLLIILCTTMVSVSIEWLVLQPSCFSWKPELSIWVLQVFLNLDVHTKRTSTADSSCIFGLWFFFFIQREFIFFSSSSVLRLQRPTLGW